MSNVLLNYGNRILHCQLPNAFVEKMHLMNASDMRLYAHLIRKMQWSNKTTLELTEEDLQALRLAPNSLVVARRKLTKLGFIRIKKFKGNRIQYLILDPATGVLLTDKDSYNPDGHDREFWNLGRTLCGLYFETRLPGGKPTSNGLKCKCPFCSKRSLDINLETGQWNCFSCSARGGILDFEMKFSKVDHSTARDNLRGIMGLEAPDKSEIIYFYADKNGREIFQEVKKSGKKGRKMRQADPEARGGYRWDIEGCERVLYRLPEVVEADRVIVVEGPHDANTLSELGWLDPNGKPIAVTTNPLGAMNWLDTHTACLKGKHVAIIGDTDAAGKRHAADVYDKLKPIVKSVVRVELPKGDWGKDPTDFVETQGAIELYGLLPEGWLHQRCEA